jgi:hypothetical protein
MYQELLQTDEGGLSSVVASLGRLNSILSLLQRKGLLPASGATNTVENTSCVVEAVGEHAERELRSPLTGLESEQRPAS